jgi:hypothetical protein
MDDSGFESRQGREIFVSSKRSGSVLRTTQRPGLAVTAHLHLVMTLRMSGVMPLLPLSAFMGSIWKALLLLPLHSACARFNTWKNTVACSSFQVILLQRLRVLVAAEKACFSAPNTLQYASRHARKFRKIACLIIHVLLF